jgi:hypothetical protein
MLPLVLAGALGVFLKHLDIRYYEEKDFLPAAASGRQP